MTLFEKVWNRHVVQELPGGNALVFVDLVVAHEITTPAGARDIAERFGDRLYDARRIVAINDHVSPAKDTETAVQAHELRTWAKRHGIRMHDIGDNGICHVVVPERGYVRPGMTVCCGDSHTCTLGAFGAVAIGIGTSAQAGAMLAGCLVLRKPAVVRIVVTGRFGRATAKDLAMTVVAHFGVGGATGCVLEYTGCGIASMSMEERMTLCNMAVEAGATTAIIAADGVTTAYLEATAAVDRRDRPLQNVEAYVEAADADAAYDTTLRIDASSLEPLVTWGTNPGECAPVHGAVPADANAASIAYMGLAPGQALRELALDQAFIGSCTNARLSDLRDAACVLRGKRVAIPTIVTPGSQAVKRAAEREGLHEIFQDAGALWTHASCGPCLGMSMGVVAPQTRCISSSNRNFPGRMGAGGRVHLASPRVVAASALAGRIASPEDVA